MHVVLLGAVREIIDAVHDRIVAPDDVDPVVDDVAWVGHPLTAAHELVFRGFTKGIAHAAVIAAKADTALDCLCQVELLVLRKLGHRVDRDDQAQTGDRRVGEYLGRGFDAHAKPFLFEHRFDDARTFFRLVSIPAAPYDQRLPHILLRQLVHEECQQDDR